MINENDYFLDIKDNIKTNKKRHFFKSFISQILYCINNIQIKICEFYFKDIFTVNSFIFWSNFPIWIILFIFCGKKNVGLQNIDSKFRIWFYLRNISSYIEEYLWIQILKYLRIATGQIIISCIILKVEIVYLFYTTKKFYINYLLVIIICIFSNVMLFIIEFDKNCKKLVINNDINDGILYSLFFILFSFLSRFSQKKLLKIKYDFHYYNVMFNSLISFFFCVLNVNFGFKNLTFILISIFNGFIYYLAYYFQKDITITFNQFILYLDLRIIFIFVFAYYLLKESLYFFDILIVTLYIGYTIYINYYSLKTLFQIKKDNNKNLTNIRLIEIKDEDISIEHKKQILEEKIDIINFKSTEFNIDYYQDFSQNNKYGYSPLHLACYLNDIKFIESKIKENKEQINIKSNEGYTPLYIAVKNGHANIVKELIENGGNENIKCNNGDSPIDIAKSKLKDYKEILKLFKTKDNIYNNFAYERKIELSIISSNNEKQVDNNDINIHIDFLKIKDNKNEIIENNLDLSYIKPRGLKNIGGSCYMNTVLQCFFHVKKMTQTFIEDFEKEENLYKDLSLTNAYISVIKGLENKKNELDAFGPIEFKESLIEINDSYKSNGNDPKDVVLDILYNIHSELNNDNSIQLNNKLDKLNKYEVFNYYKDEEERTKSLISTLFSWCKQTKRLCKKCNNISYDYIYEFLITFGLEKLYKKKLKKGKNLLLNLNECFQYYFTEEQKSFYCPSCKEKELCNISNKICILSKYLIIILDRGKNDNFNCHIDFDYNLDLTEFTEQIENEKYNTKYELIGATFLIGESGAGHTVAFCKHFDNKYYIFNDSYYYLEDLSKLRNNKAFLLFYERKDD